MKYRLISALSLIPLVIAALFFFPLSIFSLVVFLVCLCAAWEWAPLAGFRGTSERLHFLFFSGALLGAILALMEFYALTDSAPSWILRIDSLLWIALMWWWVALLLVLSYPQSAIFWRNSNVLRIIFGFFTVAPFFWGMFVLRTYDYAEEQFIGAWWLLYVLLLVWVVDSGAYFCGTFFGAFFKPHKLMPKISPGKTWEGLIGGLVLSASVPFFFIQYTPIPVVPEKLLLCSMITACAAVLGDLTESMFKREAGIKDSGNLIPGHGGMLDRIDSLMAAVPVFAYLMQSI